MDADIFTRTMFGAHAVHVPAWMYVQDQGADTVFVGASKDKRLRMGGGKVHQLILGEIIVRPHFVGESNCFLGLGTTGLLRLPPDTFLDAQDLNILCDPMGQLTKILKGGE